MKTQKKRFIKLLVALLSLFLVPVLLFGTLVFALPSVYGDTYVGELSEKVKRLKETEGERIIVIGGSSVAFGIDSELMEEKLGKTVVNFGLYANLGTVYMMDLSQAYLHEGDIVILAPEINDQTLSLYFGAECAWQAIDSDKSLLRGVSFDNAEKLLGGALPYLSEKLSYLLSGETPTNTGAYRKENFDEYGDNDYDRPYNVDPILNSITFNLAVDGKDGTTSAAESFLDAVNDYVAAAERRGAAVYWSFPPMNEAAVDADEAKIREFFITLRDALDCEIISNPLSYILDEGYFYDSEFHTNNAGRTVHTVQLIDDIKRTLGDTSVTVPVDDLPEPPGFDPYIGKIEDGDASDFVLEKTVNATAEVYKIVGLSEQGKTKTKLVIPLSTEGTPIAVIGADAFSGGNATEVWLSENIAAIEAYALRGATKLTSVYLPDGVEAEDVTVPKRLGEEDDAPLFTTGGAAAVRIYVPTEQVTAYKNSYFWESYAAVITAYDPETR